MAIHVKKVKTKKYFILTTLALHHTQGARLYPGPENTGEFFLLKPLNLGL